MHYVIYKRIVAFDVGDTWIGVAHTDFLQTIVIPHDTWKYKDFDTFFAKYLLINKIESVVVGLPKTLEGRESQQTTKVIEWVAQKRVIFENIEFIFFDERLTSQFAKKIIRHNKSNKNSDHSVAAGIILENYLVLKNK